MIEKSGFDYCHVLPGELTAENIDATSDFLDSLTPSGLQKFAVEHTVQLNFEGQDFNMLIDSPKDGDKDKVLLVMSEYGTGLVPRLVVKSLIMRDAVDPKATLVIQPSSVWGHPNMNYSASERQYLKNGNSSPIVGRIAATMSHLDNPKDITIYGSSQGAKYGLDYASDDEAPKAIKVVITEVPNIVERSFWQLAIDFAQDGHDLSEIVRANFKDHGAPFAVLAEKNTGFFDKFKFMLSSVNLDNIASIQAMCHESATESIRKILEEKNGVIVHAWGDRDDNVSPCNVNQLIANRYEKNAKYTHRILKGVGHTCTDLYALDAELVKIAQKI